MRDLCIVHQVEDCPACMRQEIELLRDGAKRAVDDAYALAEENRRLTALVEEQQTALRKIIEVEAAAGIQVVRGIAQAALSSTEGDRHG